MRNKFHHLLKRINNACAEYLPRDLLTKFSQVRDQFCPFPTLGEKGICSSVSVASNHLSALHVDKDFFFSYLTARSECTGKSDLNSKAEPSAAHHFMFPTIGYAVSIRPGDIIIFNPTIPHCCSHKLVEYENVTVYLSSFYVKTAHIGGNDNSRPLTKEQEKYVTK